MATIGWGGLKIVHDETLTRVLVTVSISKVIVYNNCFENWLLLLYNFSCAV